MASLIRGRVPAMAASPRKLNGFWAKARPNIHFPLGVSGEVTGSVAMKNAKEILPEVKYCKDIYDTAKGADALVIVTEWNQFRNLDLERIRKILKQPYFFDLRNIYEPAKMKKLGFKYFCTGRS